MKTFKIQSIIPAAYYETFVVEANNAEEAFEKLKANEDCQLIKSETTLTREDIEYTFPEEI